MKKNIYLVDSHELDQFFNNYTPVFILSTGRSGTKFISKLLSCSSKAASYHEPRPELQYFCHYAYSNQDQSVILSKMIAVARLELLLDAYVNGKIYVETNQCLVYFASQLARMFPSAKFVHLVRNPYDFMRSAAKKGFYNKDNIWENGRIKENDPDRWNKFTKEEKLAWYWTTVNNHIESLKSSELLHGRIQTFTFESLLKNDGTLFDFIEFIGIDDIDKELVFSFKDRKLNSVDRQMYYTYNIDLDSPRLKAKLEDIIDGTASRYGYSLSRASGNNGESRRSLCRRVLVLTMYSGENEFDSCIKSVQAQTHSNWDHKKFENLPNKEAHDALYSEIMAQKDNFDLFIKLDADMIFNDEYCMEKIVALFEKYPDMDHAETILFDWFSNSLIWGLHIFTGKACWRKDSENLFVDYNPKIPGQKKRFCNHGAPFVTHCPNPSPFHAYHFGIHRGLKALQFGKTEYKLPQVYFQWELINKVWENYKRIGDRRLGLVVMGFEDALGKYFDCSSINYTNEFIMNRYKENYENLSNERIYHILERKWKNRSYNRYRFFIGMPGKLKIDLLIDRFFTKEIYRKKHLWT